MPWLVTEMYLPAMIDLTREWTGPEIRKMCEECGITQTELAHILGVRIATVSDWIRGVVKPPRTACVALTYLEKDLKGELKPRKQ
jgi:DNA-binding transcriptional regulator YiaG